ncbi:hypothetical protein RHMOL_Rhmol08G0240100 [Rhododendron molle]|uniref:Uncharacterized protein n=1 Tax=Rhododendron molle TaxID=49168 RepID=A0ACC0MTC1_RHOML|nr:hypothetical protein RHMOL_Rhmol08G0240100 [Rhododendron molle]
MDDDDSNYGLHSTPSDYSDLRPPPPPMPTPDQLLSPLNYQAFASPLFGSSSSSDYIFSASSALTHVDPSTVLSQIQPDDAVSASIRAKISAHPLYPKLLQAFIDCQKVNKANPIDGHVSVSRFFFLSSSLSSFPPPSISAEIHVGAPPETASLLDEIRRENDQCWRSTAVTTCFGADPELDEFMETYCDVMIKYKSDLAKPFDEATTFLNSVEAQLTSLCGGASGSYVSVITDYGMGFWASDTFVLADTVQYQLITGRKNTTGRYPDTMIRTPVLFLVLWSNKPDIYNNLKDTEGLAGNSLISDAALTLTGCEFGNGIYNSCSIWLTDETAWSSEDDFSAGDMGTHECNQKSEDRELKDKLLHKYSGYITSLKHEFSKKTKKGKLPREARQMLLDWWTMHYKWPYPTRKLCHVWDLRLLFIVVQEADKVALAELTGLDQKQINNWFINQRKRHWKPSKNMQFAVMDSLYGPFFIRD